MSSKLRANSDADGAASRRKGAPAADASATHAARGAVAQGGSASDKPAPLRFSAGELVKRPLAYPKEFVYNYFMAHEGALLAITEVGVVAGVLLLVWFLAFSGMNEPVQFIYDSF